jgi:hypothetical protein
VIRRRLAMRERRGVNLMPPSNIERGAKSKLLEQLIVLSRCWQFDCKTCFDR